MHLRIPPGGAGTTSDWRDSEEGRRNAIEYVRNLVEDETTRQLYYVRFRMIGTMLAEQQGLSAHADRILALLG